MHFLNLTLQNTCFYSFSKFPQISPMGLIRPFLINRDCMYLIWAVKYIKEPSHFLTLIINYHFFNVRTQNLGDMLQLFREWVQRVHEPVDLWVITFCTRGFLGFQYYIYAPEDFEAQSSLLQSRLPFQIQIPNACPGCYISNVSIVITPSLGAAKLWQSPFDVFG